MGGRLGGSSGGCGAGRHRGDHGSDRLQARQRSITRRKTAAWRRAVAAVRWAYRLASPVAMEFRILGPLEVLDEGRTLALGGSKQRALLALLLLHRGRDAGHGAADRRAVGRAPARRRRQVVAGPRLPAAQGAAGRARPTPGRRVVITAGTATSCGSIPSAWTRTVSSGCSPRAGASWPRATPSGLLGAGGGRSRCGAAAARPISPTSRSRRARSRGWRTCMWPRIESWSRRGWRLAATPRWWRSSSPLIADHPYRERSAGAARCSPYTAATARPSPPGLPGRRPNAGRRARASNRASACASSSGRFSPKTRRSRRRRSPRPVTTSEALVSIGAAAHRRSDVPADGHRGLVGPVGGGCRGDGGRARAARRADRAHRGCTRGVAAEGQG